MILKMKTFSNFIFLLANFHTSNTNILSIKANIVGNNFYWCRKENNYRIHPVRRSIQSYWCQDIISHLKMGTTP